MLERADPATPRRFCPVVRTPNPATCVVAEPITLCAVTGALSETAGRARSNPGAGPFPTVAAFAIVGSAVEAAAPTGSVTACELTPPVEITSFWPPAATFGTTRFTSYTPTSPG